MVEKTSLGISFARSNSAREHLESTVTATTHSQPATYANEVEPQRVSHSATHMPLKVVMHASISLNTNSIECYMLHYTIFVHEQRRPRLDKCGVGHVGFHSKSRILQGK